MNPHLAHDDEEDEDDDYADYEDIHKNNNNNNNKNTPTATSDIRCDFKSYGFVQKFTKAPSMPSSSHNENKAVAVVAPVNHQQQSYNGFHDFNAIPRANGGEDVGYPYGEKIINEKQPIGNSAGTLSRKLLLLNNQHVNLYNNNFNQPKIGNRSEPDFANRPLPQTPTNTGSAAASPLLARQRPSAPRAVCPTPPMCRTNRKGPFIFGVDNNNHQRSNSNSTCNSSPAGSPLLRHGAAHPGQQQQQQQRRPPVIEQWKYSENNNNRNTNNSPDLLLPSIPNGARVMTASSNTGTATAIRRRDVFQRTNTAQVSPHLF